MSAQGSAHNQNSGEITSYFARIFSAVYFNLKFFPAFLMRYVFSWKVFSKLYANN